VATPPRPRLRSGEAATPPRLRLRPGEAESFSRGQGRARQSPSPEAEAKAELGKGRALLLVFPLWLAQLLERGEHRCFPVRTISKGAK
jgi:hypothetical protein